MQSPFVGEWVLEDGNVATFEQKDGKISGTWFDGVKTHEFVGHILGHALLVDHIKSHYSTLPGYTAETYVDKGYAYVTNSQKYYDRVRAKERRSQTVSTTPSMTSE